MPRWIQTLLLAVIALALTACAVFLGVAAFAPRDAAGDLVGIPMPSGLVFLMDRRKYEKPIPTGSPEHAWVLGFYPTPGDKDNVYLGKAVRIAIPAPFGSKHLPGEVLPYRVGVGHILPCGDKLASCSQEQNPHVYTCEKGHRLQMTHSGEYVLFER